MRLRSLTSPQNEEKNRFNSSLEQRLQDAERHGAEVSGTLRWQGVLVHDMQVQLHNLATLVEKARRNPGCMVNVVRGSQLLSAHKALHPGGPRAARLAANNRWLSYISRRIATLCISVLN